MKWQGSDVLHWIIVKIVFKQFLARSKYAINFTYYNPHGILFIGVSFANSKISEAGDCLQSSVKPQEGREQVLTNMPEVNC